MTLIYKVSDELLSHPEKFMYATSAPGKHYNAFDLALHIDSRHQRFYPQSLKYFELIYSENNDLNGIAIIYNRELNKSYQIASGAFNFSFILHVINYNNLWNNLNHD